MSFSKPIQKDRLTLQKNNLGLNFNTLISAKDDLNSDNTSAMGMSHLNLTFETKNLKKDMQEIKNEFR